MKNIRKFVSILLALVLAAAMMPAAFAEDNGSITINGASEDNIYEIYRMLKLESYDTAAGAYAYKVEEGWEEFFARDDIKAYMSVDADGYVTWNGDENDERVSTFAKAALAYAVDQDLQPEKSSENEGEFALTEKAGKFSGLPLGYYLIDSTMGALCGLTTTNPDASINAKNGQPTIDKTVEEDSTGQYGGTNTADIGQTVYFRTTISVHAGAQNYVLHDKMSAGLTFDPTSVEVYHVIPGTTTEQGDKVDQEDYEVVTGEGLDDECTFEVRFEQDFCDNLETNDKIIVYYRAMLNRNAVIAKEGNSNESWLDYGEDHNTTHDSTTTFSFGFDIVKTDSQNTKIDGAEFKIYDAATGGDEVPVVLMDDGVTYRRARADETGVSIVVENGQVRVVGFDNGTYYLEETKAPEGYNKLTARQKFIISDANLDAIFNGDVFSSGSGVHVVNKTGSMLPETGGIGTTLFYVVGGVLVAAAVVLLITRKRMSAE